MSEPLTDPREIRKLLSEAAYRGGRIDGEDAMTLLAYHALLRYEDALDRLIEQLNIAPAPSLFVMPSAKISPPRDAG